ncbi:MAG: hypothetical protein O7G85_07730 [Planctomycetota bacterium]|nr:hypothetical protein [Planctomycetota bacterium]
MNQALEQAREVVTRATDKPFRWSYRKGSRWVDAKLRPAVRLMQATPLLEEADRKNLSDALQIIGDTHDFNESPLAAIRAYQDACNQDPSNTRVRWDLGDMYYKIGEDDVGCKVLRECLQIDPDCEESLNSLEEVQEIIRDGDQSLHDPTHEWWQVREWISEGHGAMAIKWLKYKRSSYACLYRARVFGMLQDVERCWEQWRMIFEKDDEIGADQSDRFYRPRQLQESLKYWEGLRQCADRFHVFHDWSATGSLCNLFMVAHDKCGRSTQINIQPVDVFDFHIARLSRDSRKAEELLERHPDWYQANRLHIRLTR